jgi:predicted metal-dependent phosphotriesterase family hydrolase
VPTTFTKSTTVKWCYEDRLLLISHDAGWYDPDKPEDGTFRDFQLLFTDFLPMLKAEGIIDTEIDQVLTKKPVRAFAIGKRPLAAR